MPPWLPTIFLLASLFGGHRGQDIGNGDCLDFSAFNYFRFSPVLTYDPNEGIGGVECAQLCTASTLPHAAVVLKKYCLCARDDDLAAIKAIAKVTDELCDQSDHYVRYYQGTRSNRVEKLSLKADRERAEINEEVTFDLSVANGADVEYSLNYGDGSDSTEWSTANTLRHRYLCSGLFTPKVSARLINQRSVMATEIGTIRIQKAVNSDNINLECPTVVEPGENVDCNVTVRLGTELQMKMDFGDGTFTKWINLPGEYCWQD